MSLHRKPDLMRWNRAGLARFRYIDGNAVTYLETLRQAMSEVFYRPRRQPQVACVARRPPGTAR